MAKSGWVGCILIIGSMSVVVEDKAVSHPMGDDETAQVIAYLAAMNAK